MWFSSFQENTCPTWCKKKELSWCWRLTRLTSLPGTGVVARIALTSRPVGISTQEILDGTCYTWKTMVFLAYWSLTMDSATSLTPRVIGLRVVVDFSEMNPGRLFQLFPASYFGATVAACAPWMVKSPIGRCFYMAWLKPPDFFGNLELKIRWGIGNSMNMSNMLHLRCHLKQIDKICSM